jgi:hypothetical protein
MVWYKLVVERIRKAYWSKWKKLSEVFSGRDVPLPMAAVAMWTGTSMAPKQGTSSVGQGHPWHPRCPWGGAVHPPMASDWTHSIEHRWRQAALEMAWYRQLYNEICLPGDVPRFYQLSLLETNLQKLGPKQGQVLPLACQHGQMLDIGKSG